MTMFPAVLGAANQQCEIVTGPTVKMWLDASNAGSITSSGGAVSQWNDLSGNGYHVVNSIAANKPTTGAATLNGLNVLTFDGGDYLITNSAVSVAQPCTIFVVGKWTSGAANTRYLGHRGSDNFQFINGQAISATSSIYAGTGFVSSGGTAGSDTWYIHGAIVNGASTYTTANATNGSTGNPGTSGLDLLVVGDKASLTQGLIGAIAEIRIYASALSTTDRDTVRTALNTKWAVY